MNHWLFYILQGRDGCDRDRWFRVGSLAFLVAVVGGMIMGCEDPEATVSESLDVEVVSASWEEESAQVGHAPEGAVRIDRFTADELSARECIPDCGLAVCGPDGCGGECGICESGSFCKDNVGVCADYQIEAGTCMSLIPCQDECGTDTVCKESCAVEVPPEDQDIFLGLVGCMDAQCDACPADLPPWQCTLECAAFECEQDWVDCLGGSLDCGNIVTCMSNCAQDDSPCKYGCILHGKLLGQKLWLDLYSCIVESCGSPPSPACSTETMQGGACSALINKCKTEH